LSLRLLARGMCRLRLLAQRVPDRRWRRCPARAVCAFQSQRSCSHTRRALPCTPTASPGTPSSRCCATVAAHRSLVDPSALAARRVAKGHHRCADGQPEPLDVEALPARGAFLASGA
jgi:hypothetical protein